MTLLSRPRQPDGTDRISVYYTGKVPPCQHRIFAAERLQRVIRSGVYCIEKESRKRQGLSSAGFLFCSQNINICKFRDFPPQPLAIFGEMR